MASQRNPPCGERHKFNMQDKCDIQDKRNCKDECIIKDKFVTVKGLKKFKALLDISYAEKFAGKTGYVLNDLDFVTDEEVAKAIREIFGEMEDYNQGIDSAFATDREVDDVINEIFGDVIADDNEVENMIDDIFGN